jgi:hypothetical protein
MVRIFGRSDSPREQEFDHHIRYFKSRARKANLSAIGEDW